MRAIEMDMVAASIAATIRHNLAWRHQFPVVAPSALRSKHHALRHLSSSFFLLNDFLQVR